MELRGRVALVTGAGRGIGRDAAIALARHGAAVALNYRTSKGGAREAAAEIRNNGGLCMEVQADVSKSGEVQAMIETVSGDLGPLQRPLRITGSK